MNNTGDKKYFDPGETRSRSRGLTRVLFATFVSCLLISCKTVDSPCGAASSSMNSQSAGLSGSVQGTQQKLSKKEVAHNFLFAFIRQDRQTALSYAEAEVVNKLDWSTPHRDDVPYYDDKMILHYPGGLAELQFQEQSNGGYKITDIKQY